MKKQLRKYIAPNILAMVGTSCYVLADTFFISIAAGANGITALNLVLPIYGLIFALGSMIGVGSATRYSLHRSVGNPDARDYFSNSVWFTLLVSCIFVAAGIWFPDRVLTLLGADAEILQIGLTYTQIVLCFAPFFMLNYTFTAFVRNDNAPKLAMAATLTSGIFNIAFDYIFMFPMKMGMVGAALATGISPIVSMSVCMIHYLSKNSTIVFTWKLPSIKRFLSSCTLGVAAFVGELSSGITTMVFNFILLGLSGNTAVAAYGVIANIALVGTALFNGVSLGLQPVASSVHGQMNSDGEKRIYRHSLQISLVIACLLFMKRVAETTNISVLTDEIDPNADVDVALNAEHLTIPDGVEVYEIDGPYFFGIANKFEEQMVMLHDRPQIRIIRMRKVPFIDSTGIHNLTILCKTSQREGIRIILSGVNEQVHKTLEQAHFYDLLGEENICSHINIALDRARQLLSEQKA